MNHVIDYGNSSAKVGIFREQHLVDKRTFTSPETLREFMATTPCDNLLVSSVSVPADDVTSWSQATKKFVLHHTLPMPIVNDYATPHTLGVDRLAGVCGAWSLHPGQASLVIDLGTCVTYDFINHMGHYLGGAIAPGMAMRFQAMHTFTARLPLVKPAGDVPLIGNSTETCMQSGVIQGMTAELDGIIQQYQEKYPTLRVILCGGDALFFENKLKASIFAVPDLVLMGLNAILIHNVRL